MKKLGLSLLALLALPVWAHAGDKPRNEIDFATFFASDLDRAFFTDEETGELRPLVQEKQNQCQTFQAALAANGFTSALRANRVSYSNEEKRVTVTATSTPLSYPSSQRDGLVIVIEEIKSSIRHTVILDTGFSRSGFYDEDDIKLGIHAFTSNYEGGPANGTTSRRELSFVFDGDIKAYPYERASLTDYPKYEMLDDDVARGLFGSDIYGYAKTAYVVYFEVADHPIHLMLVESRITSKPGFGPVPTDYDFILRIEELRLDEVEMHFTGYGTSLRLKSIAPVVDM